ncbi:hypothetical protein [Planctobacterium marinum]|uniref:Phosphopantetheine adenylyltransferase n=1 Tax=Planctobacterium marinum TaxID=1631968 RepID=A0AA48HLM9_9ALTE|nr:hypothetical protein MACH26_30450 [Planctobacterium marinum]
MKIVSVCLLLVGLIHLLPLQGLFGVERIAGLYGVAVNDNNMAILLLHRAVLFGILGGFFIFSAFKPGLQLLAIVVGLISTLSFILIAQLFAPVNSAINKVVIADWIAVVLLLIATTLVLKQRLIK